MKICWATQAQQDRDDIFDTICQDNPLAAIRMDELFSQTAERLASQPRLGHPGKIPGTRELIPHASYRLVYEIDAQTVHILTLVHTARLWPLLKPYHNQPDNDQTDTTKVQVET